MAEKTGVLLGANVCEILAVKPPDQFSLSGDDDGMDDPRCALEVRLLFPPQHFLERKWRRIYSRLYLRSCISDGDRDIGQTIYCLVSHSIWCEPYGFWGYRLFRNDHAPFRTRE